MPPKDQRQQVLEELKCFGYQSQSYNILRDDKSYFFSPSGIKGVIAFVVHANVALVAGDPVCDLSDLPIFSDEFVSFCHSRKWLCCFQAITERCHDILKEKGFGMIKIGEEPFFEFDKLSWAGRKYKNLRNDTRSAKKHGLIVVEYCPLSEQRIDWEKQMKELSAAWKKFKGSGEFSFLIGEPGLENPKERKYFLAILNDQVEAFVVCTPIYARMGIYFDLMRRRKMTIRGTNQLLITESFRLLQEQGYAMATLGTAPLSYEHVSEQSQRHLIELTLKLAFDHLANFHRYKPIYMFKKQFGPSFWESRYLAYGTKVFNPIILYALMKAYDPSGVKGKLLRQIQQVWDAILELDRVPANLIKKIMDYYLL